MTRNEIVKALQDVLDDAASDFFNDYASEMEAAAKESGEDLEEFEHNLWNEVVESASSQQ